jgi:hypothetical protein
MLALANALDAARMVALSMVPARYMPEAALWTASSASLLYFSFVAIADLHQFLEFQFIRNIGI